ncbi:MAG: EAL domain-containing protein [Solobacterium sp.]|nr:EAL domain-containing protein [Solobacterium sp.]
MNRPYQAGEIGKGDTMYNDAELSLGYGKREILIAEDEEINREILYEILKDDYKILFAENGREAYDRILDQRETLSLILLDLLMPELSGIEILKRMKEDGEGRFPPVIVLTSDQNSEVECLNLGASDFIPKPYPQAAVIKARVNRTIEFYEDRQTISSTERDPLTGLYNRDYFYRYARQFELRHPDTETDAVIVDVSHFHMINERFGNRYGDKMLRKIGSALKESLKGTGGLVCRREADTFMVYVPHGFDCEKMLEKAAEAADSLSPEGGSAVRLRMGIYSGADRKLDIERRFDRAQMAADTIRSSVTKTSACYDDALHEKDLYNEQLVSDFAAAIREKQFKVFFQPKFDIRADVPTLTSAEALVRWVHPTLGFISPGNFIPLFEGNGLIYALDRFVWESTAAAIRDWKDRLGYSVPVSVNVSRIDMYDPHLVDEIADIVKKYNLSSSDILLEITESAYTQDSSQIIETVTRLRKLGFKIEMDDFGTGYSSLNMISTLPVDALKLDMQFIRNAFSHSGDTWILEVILNIASYMAVPTIAEGVETEEQLKALKELGCDIVQGYYFSRPVPAEEFEPFLLKRKDQEKEIDLMPNLPKSSQLRLISASHERAEAGNLSLQQRKLYEAYFDRNTRLFNRRAFALLLGGVDQNHVAVLTAKIDHLDQLRKEQGEEGVLKAIRHAAEVLSRNFRSADSVCCMGEGMFAVILTRANSSLSQMIINKSSYVNYLLKHPDRNVPPVSLSIGAAFGDKRGTSGSLYDKAVSAMERVSESGGDACAVY